MRWMQFFPAFLLLVSVHGQDEKGLVISTFPGYWDPYAKLISFIGDADSFESDKVGSFEYSLGTQPLITSVSVDAATQSLYYLEAQSRTIRRFSNFSMYFNSSGSVPDEVIHEGISRTLGHITFDWVNQNYYWTDGYFNWIGVQPAFNNDSTKFKAIMADSVTVPLGIAVDPINGVLFWSDLLPSPRIETCRLNGRGRFTFETQKLLYPSALTLDTQGRRIYWGDSERGELESQNYEGTNRMTIAMNIRYDFGAVAIYNNLLCYTDKSFDSVSCHRDKLYGEEVWYDYTSGQPWGLAVTDINSQPQITDNCASAGCSHFCTNIDNRAECMCWEGHDLNPDGKTCTATHALTKKGVLFTNGTNLCVMDIRAITSDVHIPQCIVANITGAKYVQADPRSGMVYYWDSNTKLLKEYNIVQHVLTDVTTAITGDVTGLFYDWVNKEIYWSENDTATIKMIDLQEGSRQLKIRFSNVKNVGYLIGNPHKVALYWISGVDSSSMVIESGRMDGTGRTVLVQTKDVEKPMGLYYDEVRDRIFWIDSGSVKRQTAKADSEITTEFTGVGDANSLLLYKDYIIWTSGSFDVYVAALTATSPHKSFNITEYNNVTGLCIFDPRVQAMFRGPCQDNNGGCQHICKVTSLNQAECECDFGFYPRADNKLCQSEPLKDNFLLAVDYSHNMIYQVPTDKGSELMAGDIVALNITQFEDPVGVAYDDKSGFVYWSELTTHRLRRGKLNGENVTTLKTFSSHFPDRLLFEKSTGNLFFTATLDSFSSDERSYIGVLSLKHDPTYPKELKLVEDLNDPRCLALYPQKGFLFFGEASYFSPYIGRYNMDAKDLKKVTANVDVPLGISIDYINDMVYWADYGLDKIYRVDIEFQQDPEEIFNTKGYKIADMVLYGSYIYTIGWNAKKIKKINKISHKAEETFMTDIPYFGRLDNLRIFPDQIQPVSRYCYSQTDKNYNGRCSTFCLPTPGNRTCACEGDVALVDGFNCENVCRKKIYHGAIKDCTIFPGALCDYTCDKFYEKNPMAPSDGIKCMTNTSWSVPEHQLCQEKKCKETISNGRFTGKCNAEMGNTCTFECLNGHKAKKYQYPTVVCYAHTDGQVRWNVDIDSICEAEVYCQASVPNGNQTCRNPTAGSVCQVTCNTGYLPFSRSEKIVCLSTGEWSESLDHICRPLKPCPVVVENGKFEDKCKGNTYEKCLFSCKAGYETVFDGQLVCLSTGAWSIPTNTLCKKPEVSVTGASQSQSSAPVVGGVLGVILAILIIIIVIGAVCYFTRRREMRSAVYKNEPNVYFNNPPVDEHSYNQFNQPANREGRYHQFSNPMTERENAYDMIAEKGDKRPQEGGPATYYLRDVEEKKLDTSLKVKGGDHANLVSSMEDQNATNKAREFK